MEPLSNARKLKKLSYTVDSKNLFLVGLDTLQRLWHSGGDVMVWGSFSGHGIVPLQKFIGKMNRFMNRDITRDVIKPFTKDNLPVK